MPNRGFQMMDAKREKPMIFVAGSTGMVGSAICRRLRTLGYDMISGPVPRVDLRDQARCNSLLKELRPDWVFLAAARARTAIQILGQSPPEEPPEWFEAWPAWYSAFNFHHNRMFGGLLILGLIADTVLRIFLPEFWPMG